MNKEGGKPQRVENYATRVSVLERELESLSKRLSQFTTLAEVGIILNTTLDHEVVRRMAMEVITRLMKAEAGSLLLVDDAKRELYFEVALGEKGKKVKEIRLGMGEGIAGWVAEHGEPLLIQDVTKDPRFYKLADSKSGFVTRNMVCVPLRVKERVIGVLQAINKIEGTFTGEDMKLFQLFSNQVAIALDNAILYEEIREAFLATAEVLTDAIEKRDPYTGGHTRRVLKYSLAIAKHLSLSPKDVDILRFSAVLHDIGKIGVEDKVLRKNGPLHEDEVGSMMLHPTLGAEMISRGRQLKDIIPGILYHHERVDGTGYPMGLKGDNIPIIARVISVCDTYDAMTTDRPYRKGLTPEMVLEEIRKGVGTQFHKDAVEAFIKAFEAGEII